jgi:Tol biopolymer transport system component
LPIPVSTTLELSDSQPPVPVKKRRGRGCLWVIGLLVVLSMLLGLFYIYNPAMAVPALNQAATPVSQFLDRMGISTDFLAGISFGTGGKTQVAGAIVGTPTPSTQPSATQEPTHTLQPTIKATATPTTQPTDTPIPSDTPVPSETVNPTATPMGGGYGQIAFASDRTGLAQIWLINVDGTNLHQITESPWGACQPDWSPDGSRLIYTSPCEINREIYRGSGLFLVNADGTNPVSLPVQGIGDYDPAWSPDGKKVAFTSLRTNSRPRIMVMDLETGEVFSLSQDNNWDSQPAWSSDGSQIVFISTRNGPYQIWTMDADGSNQARFSVSKDLKNTNPALSPDQRLLVFTQSAGEGSITHLRGVPFPDGAEEEYDVYPFSGAIPMRDADFSTDGFWIAFESWPTGVLHDIFFMAPNGAGFTQLTTDPALDFDPAWRPIIAP